jgi:hypothetical protein
MVHNTTDADEKHRLTVFVSRETDNMLIYSR